MRIIDPPANESHNTIQIWSDKLSGPIIRGAENSDKVAKCGQNRGILDWDDFLGGVAGLDGSINGKIKKAPCGGGCLAGEGKHGNG